MARYAEALQRGETVTFRPRGNSMAPRIRSGQTVTLTPAINKHGEYRPIQMGDVVLCKVRGRLLLHKVTGIRYGGASNSAYRISNNRGRVNGWAAPHHVYGILEENTP